MRTPSKVRFAGLTAALAAQWILAATTPMILVACGGGPAPANRPPLTVGVVTVEPQPVPLTTELAGRTSPFEIADVRPQVNGIIKARLFAEGSIVRTGQVLYQIDPAPYRAAYDQAAAQLVSAQANLIDSRLKAERDAELIKLDSVSRQDNDDAENAFKQAQAAVQQDEAAREAAKINLDYTRVTAPIMGRIGISTVTQGALVTASQTTALSTIQRLDPIYVDVTQSADQILALREQLAAGGLSKGQVKSGEVRLSFNDGSTYPLVGRIQFTDITVDQTTGTVTLRALFPNPSGLLLPGMYVRAAVVEGVDPSGLLVPQQGVGRDDKGNPTALVVNARGVVELRQLRVGEALAGKWLVTSGLAAGDRVIVDGIQSANVGAHVNAVPASLQ